MATNEKLENLEAENTPGGPAEKVDADSPPAEEELQAEQEVEPGPPTENVNDSEKAEHAGVDESISDVIGELENEGPAVGNVNAGGFQESGAMGMTGSGPAISEGNIDLLMDVNVTVRAELGKTVKSIEEILSLNPGMLVELDRVAGDNIDLYLNDKIFASGEVTVVDGNFAIRIVSLAGKSDKGGRLS